MNTNHIDWTFEQKMNFEVQKRELERCSPAQLQQIALMLLEQNYNIRNMWKKLDKRIEMP